MQTPQGCAREGPCCILQQSLQHPLEQLQCLSRAQNADATRAAASAGDSLREGAPASSSIHVAHSDSAHRREALTVSRRSARAWWWLKVDEGRGSGCEEERK
jgi:hypothetical protein